MKKRKRQRKYGQRPAAAIKAPSRFWKAFESPWFLAGVLVFAALLRLAHVWAIRKTPFFLSLDIDPRVYDEWAQKIAAGDWIGKGIFYQDPLYPYFLAILYRIFGRDLMLVRIVQVAFGVGTCWLTAALGRQIFGKAVGNVAGLVAALFAPSIFYEAEIEKTFLSVFLVACFLVFALKRTTLSRLLAGVFLALACLTRANLLVFVPLGFLIALFELSSEPETESTAKDSEHGDPSLILGMFERGSIAPAFAFVAGACIVLFPVAWRNHHVGGEWVLATSQGGQNFYLGNNPENHTGGYIALPFQRPNPLFEQDDFKAEAEIKTGHALTPAQASSYWYRRGISHILDHTGFALGMFGRKFAVFWNDYEVPDNQDIYFLARDSWVLRLPLVTFGLLVPLALLGAVAFFRKKREVRLLAEFTGLYCLTVVAFFVLSRYRMQIVPVMAVLTAAGGQWLYLQLKESRWPRFTFSRRTSQKRSRRTTRRSPRIRAVQTLCAISECCSLASVTWRSPRDS